MQVHSLSAKKKKFLFLVTLFIITVLVQTIHFSPSIVFVHTQLNVKPVLFQVIQFNISTDLILSDP